MKIPSIAGLRSFLFGLLALIATESALIVLIVKVKDSVVVTALAPIFAGFFSAVGVVVGAVIVKHSVESLATGGGIAGAWKTLTTPAKPGDPPPPPPAAGFARLPLLVLLVAVAVAAVAVLSAPARAGECAVHRSDAQLAKFKAEWTAANGGAPCPETCKTYVRRGSRFVPYERCGACQVDHLCPLACCGVDAPSNMHWMDKLANLRKGADCTACPAKAGTAP